MPTDLERRLAELILAKLGSDERGPGNRLPTERQLAVDFGVSRTAVRHALATIEADGHISREVGRGTFLRTDGLRPDGLRSDGLRPDGRRGAANQTRAATIRPIDDVGPADVMAVRCLLEPPAMALAVAWATTRDLDELQRCLAGGAAARTYEEFEVWDLALHRSVIAASHSRLLIQIYAVVEASRQGQMWGDLKRRSDSPQRRRQYQLDHKAVVAALRARDSDGAVEAMRVHLDRVADYLLGRTRR